jgi:hypothetical protein
MQGHPLTTQDKQKFLAKLKSSHGNVAAACRAIKISRGAAYEHKKTDADFSAGWEEVLQSVYDEAEKELYVRSVKGWREAVWHKGEVVGYVIKKSDRLLEFFLKGNRAEKFRERLDLNAHHTGNLDVNLQASIDKIYADGTDTDTEGESAGEHAKPDQAS